ncbi:MAG: PAS domain S-box protein [Oscillochloridaceae bacterium umkhey_bin13]
MPTPLTVLILEDRDTDAILAARALHQADFEPAWHQVVGEDDYRAALADPPDLIIADYTLPQFDAIRALDVLTELGLAIPFIIVSGTINEETAILAMRRGADDYLLKDRLARLGMAVRSALQRHQLRREQQTALAQLQASERRFRALIEHSADGIALLNRRGTILYTSPAAERITGFPLTEFTNADALSFVHPRDQAELRHLVRRLRRPAELASAEFRVRCTDGSWRWVEAFLRNLLRDDAVAAIVVNYRDITARMAAEEELHRYADELVALHHMERRARLHAETLRSANLALTNSLELDSVIEALFAALTRLAPYDCAEIFLLREGAITAIYRSLTPDRMKIINAPTDFFDLESSPLHQRVLINGPSLVSDDQTYGVAPGQSWLGVPLKAFNRMVGLCTVVANDSASFTNDHLRWVEAIASQAAIAIQNAHLYDEVQYGRRRLQSLSHQLIQAQETERRHLARELHDEIGQLLVALQMNLHRVQKLQPNLEPQTTITDSIALVNQLIQQIRSLSRELRPQLLDELGLVPALSWHIEQIASRTKLEIKLTTHVIAHRFPLDVELSAFRIVQEALTNVIKHAQARHVRVDLRQYDNELRLAISDDGVGFESDEARSRAGGGASLGLINMQERALLANGTLEVIAAPEAGTCIRVTFILPDDLPTMP